MSDSCLLFLCLFHLRNLSLTKKKVEQNVLCVLIEIRLRHFVLVLSRKVVLIFLSLVPTKICLHSLLQIAVLLWQGKEEMSACFYQTWKYSSVDCILVVVLWGLFTRLSTFSQCLALVLFRCDVLHCPAERAKARILVVVQWGIDCLLAFPPSVSAQPLCCLGVMCSVLIIPDGLLFVFNTSL